MIYASMEFFLKISLKSFLMNRLLEKSLLFLTFFDSNNVFLCSGKIRNVIGPIYLTIEREEPAITSFLELEISTCLYSIGISSHLSL
jgi:hypothetical protein